MKRMLSVLWKISRWLLGVFIICFVLIAALAWYFTATNSGYQKLPALITKLTPFMLTTDHLEGNLFSKQSWENVHFEGAGVTFSAQAFSLGLRGNELFKKRLHVTSLQLNDAKLILPKFQVTPEKQESQEFSIPSSLPTISLPLAVDVDALQINKFVVYEQDQQNELLSVPEASASIHGKDSEVTAQLSAQLKQGEDSYQATLQAKASLKGDYPIDLQAKANLELAGKTPEVVNLQMKGSLLSPSLQLTADGWANANIALGGKIDLAKQQMDMKAVWGAININHQEIEIPQGSLSAIGPFSEVTAKLNTALSGKAIPSIVIAANSQINIKEKADTTLDIKLLDGEVQLKAETNWKKNLAWQADVIANKLLLKKLSSNLDGEISTHITTQGKTLDNELQASAEILSLKGQWLKNIIDGKGKIDYQKGIVKIQDLTFSLGKNELTANGDIAPQHSQLSAILQADDLSQFWHGLSGNVKVAADVSGELSNPKIQLNGNWNAISYQNIVRDSYGTIVADGLLAQGLEVTLQGKLSGENIPHAEVKVEGLVSDRFAKNVTLALTGSAGEVHLSGESQFSPLSWDVAGSVSHLKTESFVKDLVSNLNANIQSQGDLSASQLNVRADLQKLSGTWQHQPVSGQVSFVMKNDSIHIDNTQISIGKNQLSVNSTLNKDTVDFKYQIDANQLDAFYPGLKGSIKGKGSINGALQSPAMVATLQGNNIAYENNRIQKLNISLDSALKKGGRFNNTISANGVDAAGLTWKSINFDSKGLFEKQTLNLTTIGGEYNASLRATGGFSHLDTWQGNIETFSATGKGMEWQLKKAFPLHLSPDIISAKDVCIGDKYSDLCASIDKADITHVAYKITKIDPRSFKQFIPNIIEIYTSISGNGDIKILADGAIQGKVDIEIAPGNLIIKPENQAPVPFKLLKSTASATFSGEKANADMRIQFDKVGSIALQGQVNDFTNPKIRGNVKVDILTLSRFQHLIPKVSQLEGVIKGNLNFAGAAANPQVTGTVALSEGKIVIPEYATVLQDIRLDLASKNNNKISIDGQIGTPEGALNTTGSLSLQPIALDLALSGTRLKIANSRKIKVWISPDLTIKMTPQTGVNVDGRIVVPEAYIAIPDMSSSEEVSEDVIVISPGEKVQKVDKTTSFPIHANIEIQLGDKIYYQDPNAKIRLNGGISVAINPNVPIAAKGRIQVAKGTYDLYGQELNINRGWATFSGDITQPMIDIIALRDIQNVKVGAQVRGTPSALKLTLTSDPSMPDSAVLSYLLFGKSPDSSTDGTALLQMAASLGTKGLFPKNLAQKTGLDVFDVGIGGIKAGKYLLKDLYIGLNSDFFSQITKFLARYQISERLSAEAYSLMQAGDESNTGPSNGIDLLYEFETN